MGSKEPKGTVKLFFYKGGAVRKKIIKKKILYFYIYSIEYNKHMENNIICIQFI